MTSTKTIVITLPRHLNPAGGSVVVPATSPAATTINSNHLSSFLAGNCIQVIKNEPRDGTMEEDDSKPPRKRQRLDHLSMEEKLMRRKLKNRVAAQTARDRKKLRMDQLEAQLTDLKEHIGELTSLTTILSDQNEKLVEENEELEQKLERCTCRGRNVTDNSGSNSHGAEVAEGIMVPVSAPTTGSAVSLPQQRAVGALAVIRIMVLSTLCSQWMSLAAMTVLNKAAEKHWSDHKASQMKQPVHSLPVKKRPTFSKWWGPQQQSWNPTGI